MNADEHPPGVKLVRTLQPCCAVGRIAWSPDGRLLASPSNPNGICLWDATAGVRLSTLECQRGYSDIHSVAFGSRGLTLAAAREDHTAVLWGTETRATEKRWADDNASQLLTLVGHKGAVNAVAFDRSDCILASGSSDGTVKLWDVGRFVDFCDPFTGIMGPRIWEVGTGQAMRTLEGHNHAVFSVAFDHLAETLASGSGDNTIKLWNVATAQLRLTLKGHRGPVYSVAFDHSGKTLVSGSGDWTVKLWDAASGRLLRTLEHPRSLITCVSFLDDGRLLASKGSGGSLGIWATDTGVLLAEIREPASRRWTPGLAFHPRLPLLATVGSSLGTMDPDDCDTCIHIYELDARVLLTRGAN